MDNLILEGVVRSLARALPGQYLLSAERCGECEYVLRFASPAADRLLVRIRPPHSALHRRDPRVPSPALPPDPFTVLLHGELEGARLERIERPCLDRVVEMQWETRRGVSRTIVAELFGKAANVLLLDERRTVLGYARQMASAFRAPVEGRPYRPPAQQKGLEGITLESVAGQGISGALRCRRNVPAGGGCIPARSEPSPGRGFPPPAGSDRGPRGRPGRTPFRGAGGPVRSVPVHSRPSRGDSPEPVRGGRHLHPLSFSAAPAASSGGDAGRRLRRGQPPDHFAAGGISLPPRSPREDLRGPCAGNPEARAASKETGTGALRDLAGVGAPALRGPHPGPSHRAGGGRHDIRDGSVRSGRA